MGRALAAEPRPGRRDRARPRPDQGRIAATVAEVAAAAGQPRAAVRSYQADLASLAEVRALAGQVSEAEPRLDVLVNNAGIGINEPGGGARQESADGLELRFAVNYLAGYALSRHLLPLLTRSAPSRIVNVASVGQQAIDFGDVMLTKDYDGMRAYRQSKLAQVMNTFDLAAELEAARCHRQRPPPGHVHADQGVARPAGQHDRPGRRGHVPADHGAAGADGHRPLLQRPRRGPRQRPGLRPAAARAARSAATTLPSGHWPDC